MNKIIQEAIQHEAQLATRRHFLSSLGTGLGSLALGSFLTNCSSDSGASFASPLSAKSSPKLGKAKSVIFLHMAGAPSQLELFDYKPSLAKFDGKECPPELLAGKKFAFIRGVPNLLGPKAHFEQRGQAGHWISDYLPHLASQADRVSFLKGMHTDQFNHAPAQLLMHTGSARLGRPSMGSWVSYGLGSENQNLPGFVVLASGGKNPDAGKSAWGSGFLPSIYQGVQCRSEGEPILFIQNPAGINSDIRKASIETINQINQETYQEFGDPETVARIAQYEMAYKMQSSVPEVMDINKEPAYIHEMYGTEPGKESFANNCLLARKLVEQGVRFVQLFDWGWDTHGTGLDGSVDYGLHQKCRQVDKAATALLLDLEQRGLLDETLVVWGGEFGRTPMQENREGKKLAYFGRDHHTEAFTMWLAGGGIKPGVSYGETDDLGYSTISGKTSVYDLQATILQCLGFNHEEFTYPFQGRNFRLTDVFGKVIDPILA
ncbi:DUF1501 domain-containing protein [Aquirufa aurantiipilula]|uniref:DUF1501 domain-containing protein n=1 Tax=Aquirufa aurantiipilula TaxID=2696561 RepID=A0ABT6BMU5_9BACT|nr:DUF1501 domain-containing protein [Aquirufa aurantiipilula]MBZ1327300.1 DUF1501 domain-containing protein [Aquirufa aurantiipilula]MDF5690148.1 DUF1501 domain-containing protein [Aquirufa aurantiipilula]